ncbi:hypothetical protein BJF78_02340 [Pseudonocardia sp. CNS-139]|nr:hypothetical protein BJF78_02340 [Pseudonocardia sp. CNS-139]
MLGVVGDLLAPFTCPRAEQSLPAELIDLSSWKLTLPVGEEGRPQEILLPGLLTFASEHFGLTPNRDGVVFRAPAGGVTTENSNYPRSELREMRGGERAAWSNTAGTHVMEVREAITRVPPVKPEVVSAQIHDGSDDVIQIRLRGRTLELVYDDGDAQVTLDPDYALGTPFDLRIVAENSRIAVFHNGVQKADLPRSGTGWYWKVGAYTQSNPGDGDRPDAVGEVVVYALRIEHAGG